MTAVITTFLVMLNNKPKYPVPYAQHFIQLTEDTSFVKNWPRFSKEETERLSVLGRILYLGEKPPKIENELHKTYEILVWKYGKTIENRHLKNFGTELVDPFEACSVKNCKVTFDDNAINTADIVIFHLHRMKDKEISKVRGPQSQIWAFLTDESPYHTFINHNSLSNYNGVFNWSMTYRMDSDIPVPYGRTILRDDVFNGNLTFTKRTDVLVAILISDCAGKNNRWDYIREMQKHITVHIYGACGTMKGCAGYFRSDCPDIGEYLFYLAFENSNCDGYVTEKVWWNAYSKNSIPIVMGATKDTYEKLLPPKSYLNIDDYDQPKDLANYVVYLNRTGKYRDYYQWKRNFQVLNEHGYFQSRSYHYCRVCEALNYNNKETKIYDELRKFWSVPQDCHLPWNA